jgi:hypothetical protein
MKVFTASLARAKTLPALDAGHGSDFKEKLTGLFALSLHTDHARVLVGQEAYGSNTKGTLVINILNKLSTLVTSFSLI